MARLPARLMDPSRCPADVADRNKGACDMGYEKTERMEPLQSETIYFSFTLL